MTKLGQQLTVLADLALVHVLVELDYLLDVALAAKEDWAALVQLTRYEFEDALAAIHCHPAGGFDEVGHGEALVQQTQLAALVFLVSRVEENATIQQRAVNVGDHGADVARRVCLVRGLDVAQECARG